ncbi:FAD-dependent monooxygenase [Streptomyces sp. NPDC050504]|uniref:FAD-dependent monooxygenase n=1 Tax=Streptomyces sp. NPDC050504 TaxID=3365618 RepID=UPI003789E702
MNSSSAMHDAPLDNTYDTSVVVVGSGPTGLLLAGDLAAAGVAVTVVEKRPAGISNLSRAFGVHARTLEQLDARGLADELVKTGRAVTELRLFGSLALDLSELPSRFPYMLITPQYEVERLLLRRAEEHGVRFLHGALVTDVEQGGERAGEQGTGRSGGQNGEPGREGVTVRVRTEDGGTAVLRAAYAVGADGTRSTVREALGLPFPGRSVIRSIVLADVRLAEEPRSTVTVNGVGNAFGFVIPFGDGYWRIGGWDRSRGEVSDAEPVELDELRAIARRAFGTDFGMYDVRWISRFHSDERQVPAYRVGRVLLAGDAAHTHSPAGGQGMNTGLQDAANLGWKLAAVLRGEAPEALLDTYEAERWPVGRAVLRSSGAIVRLAMAGTLSQRVLRAVLARVVGGVRPVRRRALGQVTAIGYAYGPRGSRIGTRVPDVRLVEGRLYEVLRAGAYVRIVPRATAGTGSDGTENTRTGTVGTGSDGRTVLAHWASGRQDTLLVRPDGYVAG